MAITKLSLYNDALILLGQRKLSSDTEDRPNRHKLDALYDNGAVDYCLEIVKPKFASKVAVLTGGAPTSVTEYTKEATLPATFKALMGVFLDGKLDQPLTRYNHEANFILSDKTTIYVRFVQDFATTGLTYMSSAFGRVIGAYLARELSVTLDPDETEGLDAQLQVRIEVSQANDAQSEIVNKGLTNTALTAEWLIIYNDALQLLGQPIIPSINDDSWRKEQLDRARTAELVESAFEDNAWQFGMESQKLETNTAIEPAFGPTYAFDKPSDLHRLDGMYADEDHTYPIRDYVDEGDFWYAYYQTIYIAMVSNDLLASPGSWPAYFRRCVAGRLAVDAGASIPDSNMQNALDRREERDHEAASTDAMRKPPTRFSEGSWAATRSSWGVNNSRRNRP